MQSRPTPLASSKPDTLSSTLRVVNADLSPIRFRLLLRFGVLCFGVLQFIRSKPVRFDRVKQEQQQQQQRKEMTNRMDDIVETRFRRRSCLVESG